MKQVQMTLEANVPYKTPIYSLTDAPHKKAPAKYADLFTARNSHKMTLHPPNAHKIGEKHNI
jgi:hypothetical protein